MMLKENKSTNAKENAQSSRELKEGECGVVVHLKM